MSMPSFSLPYLPISRNHEILWTEENVLGKNKRELSATTFLDARIKNLDLALRFLDASSGAFLQLSPDLKTNILANHQQILNLHNTAMQLLLLKSSELESQNQNDSEEIHKIQAVVSQAEKAKQLSTKVCKLINIPQSKFLFAATRWASNASAVGASAYLAYPYILSLIEMTPVWVWKALGGSLAVGSVVGINWYTNKKVVDLNNEIQRTVTQLP
jgi:hypothetical protein